jgi:hypothetical protein
MSSSSAGLTMNDSVSDEPGNSAKPQVSPLRYPRFPVQTRGVDALHAAL